MVLPHPDTLGSKFLLRGKGDAGFLAEAIFRPQLLQGFGVAGNKGKRLAPASEKNCNYGWSKTWQGISRRP